MNTRELGLVTAALALVADQASKLLLLYGFGFAHMSPLAHVDILPFFNLVMVWNRGVSYGLFPASGPFGTALLDVLSVAAVAGLGIWLWRSSRRALAVGLGLVIGGALGNLIDRLVYGAVADFFHFHAFGYDWYVFNVADAAIVVGVMALLYDALLRPESPAARITRTGSKT